MFDYEPGTGRLVFRQREDAGFNTRWAGKRAGSIDAYGYRTLVICGRRYLAGPVIWAIQTGEYPPTDLQVDHKNRIRNDNRWDNLRLATPLENSNNCGLSKANTSGFKGVSWIKSRHRWRVQICVDGKRQTIGAGFRSAADAHAAYLAAERNLRSRFSEF